MRKKFLLLIFSFCLLVICSCSNECNGEHDYDDGVIISSPTCTSDGKLLYTCKKCKKKLTETISSLDHEKEEEWTSDDMNHYHLCKNCHEYKFDKAMHEYDDSKTCICGNKKENFYQKPTAINTIFSYTGEDIVFIPSGFDENIMSITGNIQKECGTYFVVISLKDKVNNMWSDLTTDDVIISYQITLNKVVLKIPQKSSLTYTYTGQSLTYLPQGFDSSIMSITGNSKINAGEYEVIIKIKDSSKYEFENGSNEVKYQFIIEKAKLVKPTIMQTNNYYTGNDITVKLNNFNESLMNITGNTKKEVGNYQVEISLKDKNNYEWNDETNLDIKLNWEILEQELLYKITSIDSNKIKVIYNGQNVQSEMIIEFPSNSSYGLNQETGEITFIYSLESSEAIVYNFTGNYYGSIKFNINEKTPLEIELDNFMLTSYLNCPLYIESANEVDVSAKKNTENFIYDNREEEELLKGAIYSTCDLKIKGTGFLSVNSKNNNGIHSKDDLKIQKVTLYVNSVDNSLKGNDEVKITSGMLTLISRKGDGIKTSNTSLSKKNNQKGDVIIEDGTINIYSACDGIDAANSIIINGGNINIYTDKYSEYSEEVTKVNNNCYYIRSTSNYYSYSIYYYNTLDDGVWTNSNGITKTVNAGRDNYYYYEINKPEGYSYLKVYIYNSSQTQGQSSNYYKVSSQLSINNNYDTIAYGSNRPGESSSFSWTTYETVPSMRPGGGMGPGGMQEGNPNKGDYSTKGLKSDNEIMINGGVINIKSYDDCIHTNNDVTLESGASSTGNIIINNGILNLYSNDDGIHGDGTVTINNGTIDVVNSYEGIEGNNIIINGGNISVISSDDGINATSTSGIGIVIHEGTIYIFAGGDGVDSNSQSSYEGILFSGGKSVIISYGRSDSSIDTERGYKYTGGCVIGIGMSGGMSNEATHCNNFSSIGLSKTISLSKDNYLCLSDIATIKIPYTMNALVVVLGNNETNITTSSSSSLTFDKNGISYLN